MSSRGHQLSGAEQPVGLEAAISRFKRVIGDTAKSRDDARRVTEAAIAVKTLNRTRDLGQGLDEAHERCVTSATSTSGLMRPPRAIQPAESVSEECQNQRDAKGLFLNPTSKSGFDVAHKILDLGCRLRDLALGVRRHSRERRACDVAPDSPPDAQERR